MFFAVFLALQVQSAPRINLTLSPFAAQYGAIRAIQESKESSPYPGLRAAVKDLDAIEGSFPTRIRMRSGVVAEAAVSGQARVNELYWRSLDALTFSAGSVDRLNDIADAVPTVGGELDTSMAIGGIKKALEDSKGVFDADIWPQARKEAQGCIDSFQGLSAEKRDAALKFIMGSAGIVKPPKQIDVLVVPRMAGREGMTVRTPGGTLIIIGSGKYRGADFAEVVFHEATHVLDTNAGSESLFGQLRVALKAAKRSDFELEQVPHVAMFLLAAEAVRRNVDPKHKDVGDTFGSYSRGLSPLRKVVEPVLKRLIDHSIDQSEAVKEIVGGLGSPIK